MCVGCKRWLYQRRVRDSLWAISQGYTSIKIKIGGQDSNNDIEALREVRRAVGPNLRLRADANGAYTFSEAIEVLNPSRTYSLSILSNLCLSRMTPSLSTYVAPFELR
jgi:L-alanine-DL-glutamate epimerase-like enolase superfamily enzyme